MKSASISACLKYTLNVFGVVALFMLSGCFPQAPTTDFKLQEPNLKTVSKVNEIDMYQYAEISGDVAAKKITAEIILRFFDMAGVANHRVGVFHSGVGHFPVYSKSIASPQMKVRQKMYVQPMGTVRCTQASSNDVKETIPPHTMVTIWDDRDGNQTQSAVDRLYQYFNDCTDPTTQQHIEGVVTFFGEKGFLVLNKDKNWTSLEAQLDMEIKNSPDDNPGDTVLIKDALFSFKKQGDISSFDIHPGAGAQFVTFAYSQPDTKSADGTLLKGRQYAFFLNHAMVIYDDVTNIETVNFHGYYYDSEMGGIVAINGSPSNDLTFKDANFSFHVAGSSNATNTHAVLTKGGFDIQLKGSSKIEFRATTVEGETEIKFGGTSTKQMFHELLEASHLTLVAID